MKRALSFVTMCVFILSLSTFALADETAGTVYDKGYFTADMVGTTAERVDTVTLAGHTCYMYVPASNRVGYFLGFAPMLMVLGDEAFTEESVLSVVHEQGFGQIAERDGACILFANPLESWDSEADAADADALILAFYGIYSSNPTLVFENGVATKVNAETGEETKVYPGSLFGVQLMGEGKGADYIAKNYLKALPFVTNYGPQEGLEGVSPPCGVALFSPSVVPQNAGETPIPVAVVNGPENVQAAAETYADNTVRYMLIEDDSTGFTPETVQTVYDAIVSRYHFAQVEYRQSPQYTINGITEVNASKALSDGNTLAYYMYIPQDITFDVEGSVPLVLYFHGGGGEGEAMLSWTNWPQVGKKEGFVVVSVDQHGSNTSTEVIELLDELLAKYTFLNPSAVYATGFSMGGGKTWNLGFKYTDRFAAIAPFSAGALVEEPVSPAEMFSVSIDYYSAVKEDAILPVYYNGGALSPLPEMPTEEDNNVSVAMKLVWRLNNFDADYVYDATAGNPFSIKADSHLCIPYLDNGSEQVVDAYSFISADGNTYTKLCVNRNQAHNMTGQDAYFAWDFIKHFTRGADGQIIID